MLRQWTYLINKYIKQSNKKILNIEEEEDEKRKKEKEKEKEKKIYSPAMPKTGT